MSRERFERREVPLKQTIKSKTCAIVVTHNRLELLKQCITALYRQTLPCEILVIDNASTDETDRWLAEQKTLYDCMHFYRSPENLGGAGGFHTGMDLAMKAGYEWLWIMDDDSIPNENALERLMDADHELAGAYGWLSSRALWKDGTLCRMNIQRSTPYRDIKDFEAHLIPSAMASFVSLFLRRDTVCSYGLPLKEFFIWTDDWEYTRRISRHLPCYVCSESTVVHAMQRNTVVDITTDSEERLPRYRYAYRNDVYLYRREGIRGWAWLLAKDGYHTARLLFSGQPKRIAIVWKGFFQGICFHIKPEEGEQC